MLVVLALISSLISLTWAQSCETQFAPAAARTALSKVGSTDYSYSGWLNFWTPWWKRKDDWFIAETLEGAGFEHVYQEKGWLIKRQVPAAAEGYLAWFISAAGSLDGQYWEQVACAQSCVGDIQAGAADGMRDSSEHIRLAFITSTNPRRTVHINDDGSGELVEDTWGNQVNTTSQDPFVCWRFQKSPLMF